MALLTAAPIVAVAAMMIAGRIEKTRYIASLCAIVACGAFVLQTVALARIFNLRESPHFFAAWAAFALSVALPWRFTVPFALGILAAALYLGAGVFELRGHPWTQGFEHPEPVMLAGVILLPLVRLAPLELLPVGRGVLLIVALFPLLVLSLVRGMSLLPFDDAVVRSAYQLVAFVAAFAVVARGLHRGQVEVLVIGSTFAGVFIVTRFVDWWWDWMPKYLFFLIMAAVAIGWLWALRLARRRLEPVR